MTNIAAVDIRINKLFQSDKCTTIFGSYFAGKDKEGVNQYSNVKAIIMADFLKKRTSSFKEGDWINISGKLANLSMNEYKGDNIKYKGSSTPALSIFVQDCNQIAMQPFSNTQSISNVKNRTLSKGEIRKEYMMEDGWPVEKEFLMY